MKKEFLSEQLKRMRQLAGLIKESDKESDLKDYSEYSKSLSNYSNDALTDMIANLSRHEGNEEEIQQVKDELARRKKA